MHVYELCMIMNCAWLFTSVIVCFDGMYWWKCFYVYDNYTTVVLYDYYEKRLINVLSNMLYYLKLCMKTFY